MLLDEADKLSAEIIELIGDAAEHHQRLGRLTLSARAERRDLSPTELGVIQRLHEHLIARWRALHAG